MRKLLGVALCLLVTTIADPVYGQTKQARAAGNSVVTAKMPKSGDCGCSGTTGDGKDCSCECKGSTCNCACGDGTGCSCGAAIQSPVLLTAGSSVNSAVQAISMSGPLAPHAVVLAGGDQILPQDISATPWQAVARLSMIEGVRLGVSRPNPAGAMREAQQRILAAPSPGPQVLSNVQEFRRMPLDKTIGLCVHEDAGLWAPLDTLSHLSGYAFDVSGTPAQHFTFSAKGTLQEVLAGLSSAAGVTISIAR